MTKKLDVEEDTIDIDTAKIWCPEGWMWLLGFSILTTSYR